MAYLHGIEIKEGVQRALLKAGETSVIALVGTAPKGAVNEIKLITSLEQGELEYGKDIAGFTIPAALSVIFEHVSAKVLVVNVISAEKATALLEENGKMTRTEDGKLATHIYESVIPEAVDFTADIVNGIEKANQSGDLFGIKPNILIAPGYSQSAAVAVKLISVAEKTEGFGVIDVVADSTANALVARNNGAYNTTSQAAILCFPQIVRYNSNEGTSDIVGLSTYWAAAKALRDGKEGYWLSPSNTELRGVLGINTPITSSLTDPAADTNLLNGQGIVTVFRKPGTATRLWGNWTAAFPTFDTTDNMIAPRAVRMAIRESLVNSALTYMDRAATAITVDMVTGDVNAFLRDLKGAGAIVDGSCTWQADKNPATEIARGKLSFTLSVKYAPSLELITFEEVIEL